MRLIDAEAFLKKLSKMIDYCEKDQKVNGLTALFQVGDAIMDCPTIEAKPVVHAHWQKYDDSEFCYCSHCGKPAAEDNDVSWHGYCPVCGAQMDEEAN